MAMKLAAATFDTGDVLTVYQVRYKPAIHFQFCRNIGVSTTLINKQQVYEGIKRKLRVYSDTHSCTARERITGTTVKERKLNVLVDRMWASNGKWTPK